MNVVSIPKAIEIIENAMYDLDGTYIMLNIEDIGPVRIFFDIENNNSNLCEIKWFTDDTNTSCIDCLIAPVSRNYPSIVHNICIYTVYTILFHSFGVYKILDEVGDALILLHQLEYEIERVNSVELSYELIQMDLKKLGDDNKVSIIKQNNLEVISRKTAAMTTLQLADEIAEMYAVKPAYFKESKYHRRLFGLALYNGANINDMTK